MSQGPALNVKAQASVWQTGAVAFRRGIESATFPAPVHPAGKRWAESAAGDSTGGAVKEWGWDEVELIRRCREGSDAAYAVLVREHRPRLFALACRLTGDRSMAEDVVQETFLAAFKAIDRFEPKPSLSPWLNTITVRIAKRAGARARARADTSLTAPDQHGGLASTQIDLADLGVGGDPVAAAESSELRDQVAAAIERLPFQYRAAVVLRFMTGLDYAAAAEAMDVPLNTFKSHLLRGTRLLRADLARHLEPAQGDHAHGRDTPRLDESLASASLGDPVPGADPGPGWPAPVPSRSLAEPTSTRRT